MAFLKGFPLSNSINPTTYIAKIVPEKIKIGELPYNENFKHGNCEFFRFKVGADSPRVKAVCYKGDDNTTPGEIYGFDMELEVEWLRKVYKK